MKTASEARDNESKPMLSREATNKTTERRRPTTPTGENLRGNGLLGGIRCPVISGQLAKWQRKVIFLLQGFLFFHAPPPFPILTEH